MDPLSALRIAASSSGLQGAAMPKLAEQLIGQKIPEAELSKLAPSTSALPSLPGASRAGDSFSNVLGNLVQEVGAKQAASSDAVNGLLSGQNVSLHQAMLAMEEASVSFQLMVEVRNKLLESYQEMMRMQV
jgi:flagellar hook-basal body complex protein FliE